MDESGEEDAEEQKSEDSIGEFITCGLSCGLLGRDWPLCQCCASASKGARSEERRASLRLQCFQQKVLLWCSLLLLFVSVNVSALY